MTDSKPCFVFHIFPSGEVGAEELEKTVRALKAVEAGVNGGKIGLKWGHSNRKPVAFGLEMIEIEVFYDEEARPEPTALKEGDEGKTIADLTNVVRDRIVASVERHCIWQGGLGRIELFFSSQKITNVQCIFGLPSCE